MKKYALTFCLSIALGLCVFLYSPDVSAGSFITQDVYNFNETIQDGDHGQVIFANVVSIMAPETTSSNIVYYPLSLRINPSAASATTGTFTNGSSVIRTGRQRIYVHFSIQNLSDRAFTINSNRVSFVPRLDSNYNIVNIQYMAGEFIPDRYSDTAHRITLVGATDEVLNNTHIVVPPSATVSSFYYIDVDYTYTTSTSWTAPNVTAWPSDSFTYEFGDFDSKLMYDNLYKIYKLLEEYIHGDTSANDALAGDSNDVSAEVEAVHQQEQQWYSDNQDAIEATGLSNFEFDGRQQLGLGAVRSVFSGLWTSIGEWSMIYIYVLTISLATFILRHSPNTHRRSDNRGDDS